jgi:hypothetical protein
VAPLPLDTLALPGCMSPGELLIVLLGSLEDALPGGTVRVEGCHERVVLAAQDQNVWVRLVEVVVEYRKRKLTIFNL